MLLKQKNGDPCGPPLEERKGRDSNSRRDLVPYVLSRDAPSTSSATFPLGETQY